MTAEPPKIEKIQRPGPRSSKEIAKAAPPTKSAPKSKKLETPAANSLKPEPQLASASKSRKSATLETTPKPNTEVVFKTELKLRPREVSPAVQQKANKGKSVSVPTPRGKVPNLLEYFCCDFHHTDDENCVLCISTYITVSRLLPIKFNQN